jgi:hypothetical protein
VDIDPLKFLSNRCKKQWLGRKISSSRMNNNGGENIEKRGGGRSIATGKRDDLKMGSRFSASWGWSNMGRYYRLGVAGITAR